MHKRAALWALAAIMALSAAVGIREGASPVAQVDVFTDGPAGTVAVDSPAVRTRVAAVIRRIGPDRAAALLRPGFGAALAGAAPERQVLRAVEVRTVAPDRVRIRLAARDLDAARAITDGVRAGLVADGLKERLVLETRTTGGRATLVGILLSLAAGGWAIWRAFAALRAGRRRRV